LLTAVAFAGLTQGDVSSGGFHLSLDFFFRFMLFAFSIIGLLIGSKRFQLPLAFAFLVLLIIYITLFFNRLG
jgi:hypothetical protein